MNIFQLVGGAESIDQGVFSGILKYRNSWLRFKDIIDNLFATGSYDEAETTRQWAEITKNSKHLVRVAMQYYTNQLDQVLYSVDLGELKKITAGVASDKMERVAIYIGNKFNVHQNFLHDLSKWSSDGTNLSGIETQFISKVKGMLLEDLNLSELLSQYFRSLHHKHSRSILQNSMLQFDQEMSEYIRETVENTKGNFDLSGVKRVVKFIVDLSFEDESLAAIMGWITEDMRSFVKKFEDLIFENTAYLLKCEIYFGSFHSSFLQMFGELLLDQSGIERKRTLQAKLHRSVQNSKNKTYLAYGQTCAKNIFTIALTYPQSQRLVKELKKCTDRVGLINSVCEHLNEGIDKRLLIPGVVTHTILLQYINMLKVLQIIDSTGHIYQQITTPIKNYLLKRSDTLRCIINHLMTDQKQNNYSRLGTQLVHMPSREYCDIESQDEDYGEKWDILPMEKKISKTKCQEIDLVTVLVNLYGSQQSFISEYQVMLAQKLMGAKDYNIDQEIINLERLKQRFGEQALQACNIIVKDFKDSKRTDTLISKSGLSLPDNLIQPQDLHCITVSKGYWPINYEGHMFNLPKVFKPVFEQYSQKFTKIKAMRKIQFHYDLGFVNIVLQFENESVPFRCLPIHAIIISYFDESKNKEKRVSVDFLAKELDLPQTIIRQKLSYWIHKGVIRPSLALTSKPSISLRRINSYQQASAQYYVTVDIYKRPLNSDDALEEADEMIIKEGSFQAKVKLAEGLIHKIVNFNGPKSAQQISLLLKTVYRSQMNFDFTEAQAKEILKKMITKRKLTFNGQVYTHVPSSNSG